MTAATFSQTVKFLLMTDVTSVFAETASLALGVLQRLPVTPPSAV